MEVAAEQPSSTSVAPAEESFDDKTAAAPAVVEPATVSSSQTPTPAPAPAPEAPSTDPAPPAAASEPATTPVPVSAKDGPPPPPPLPTSTNRAASSASPGAAAATNGASTTSSPKPAAAQPATGEKPNSDDKAGALDDKNREGSTETPRRRKKRVSELESGSELSEPDSNLHSPVGADTGTRSPSRPAPRDLDDVIVVGAQAEGAEKSPKPEAPANEDAPMADAPAEEPNAPHYPKRKRTSIFEDLSESKIEIPTALSVNKNSPHPKLKPSTSRHSVSNDKGVIIGYWRDSQAETLEDKHAVIGFIDVRDRIRTRLQPINRKGEMVINKYPLPPGPGGTWVTFERIVFEGHLVGLDHFQVKEYVRIRSEAGEETEERRAAAEKEAVALAIQRLGENPMLESSNVTPMIAHGIDLPGASSNQAASRPESKRRRTSGGFAPANSGPVTIAPNPNGLPPPPPPPPVVDTPTKDPWNPLPGTRPTRILVGHWKKSSEPDPRNRHAVYGILGQNDMFRVKLVRETRDGTYVDGNFPLGAGALWVPYEEVEMEPHLSALSRSEIKEYCRVRQWQLDHGETPEDRVTNERAAVEDSQARIAIAGYKPPPSMSPAVLPPPPSSFEPQETNGRYAASGHDLRQSRRTEPKTEARPSRHSLPEAPGEGRSSTRAQTSDAQERTNALAQREIARAEAAQGRADRLAVNRERAAAAAAADAAHAAAAATAAASSPGLTNGNAHTPFGGTDEMQRLNKVWARQESLRAKSGAEDAKVYDGIKYERKGNGPFMGKLVSQGSIINIDGEDYVEYRVLTKPSFF